MKKNLDRIIEELQPGILRVRDHQMDISRSCRIEFLDRQKKLIAGVIYIAEWEEVYHAKEKIAADPGSAVFLAGVKKKDCSYHFSDQEERIILVETTLSPARLYNRLSAGLRRQFPETLEVHENSEADSFRKRSLFWEKIVSGHLVDKNEIRSSMERIFDLTEDYYYLVLLTGKISDIKENETAEILQSHLPAICFFRRNSGNVSEIIGLGFSDHQLYGAIEIPEPAIRYLKENNLKMMISDCTRDYGKMAMLYSLLQKSSTLAEKLEEETGADPVRIYNRYSMYLVIDMCMQRFIELYGHSDILYLIHPGVVHLVRYDHENNTDLLQVLQVYIQNGNSVQLTAEKMHMHRNSVTNRLRTIRSILPIDPEDGEDRQKLLFSCQLLNYCEKVLGLQLC